MQIGIVEYHTQSKNSVVYFKYLLTLERMSFINVSLSGLDVSKYAWINVKFSKAEAWIDSGNGAEKIYIAWKYSVAS